MKMFIKNSYLFLIFFILFFSKDFLCGLIIPKDKIEINDIYISKLEEELKDLKLINNFYKTGGVYGKVLYQNPYQFQKELVVATDTTNIEKNNYVISLNGLVGVVDKVYKNNIVVKLLTSDDLLLQVQINNCYGLLENDIISGINNYCEISLGDEVYTSNLGYMDEQIKIGYVKDIMVDPNKISNNYVIEYTHNFNVLNYVLILTKGEL